MLAASAGELWSGFLRFGPRIRLFPANSGVADSPTTSDPRKKIIDVPDRSISQRHADHIAKLSTAAALAPEWSARALKRARKERRSEVWGSNPILGEIVHFPGRCAERPRRLPGTGGPRQAGSPRRVAAVVAWRWRGR